MLIANAEVWRHGLASVRIDRGRIAHVGDVGQRPGELVIDAGGGALLPGLHDHHIHLPALAAARASVRCGPPHVTGETELAAVLGTPGEGWLRGTGYHESIAGMLDARTIDRWAPDRPVRIQHRSGRMWFLNSAALDVLLADTEPPPGLDRTTGRLFDEDAWLRRALRSVPPSFAEAARNLARCGVTGLTDMTPANDAVAAAHFGSEHAAGRLPQRPILAGTLALGENQLPTGIALGPAKLHLHEAALPEWTEAAGFATAAHDQGRAVAVHCTTEAELVFALAILRETGPRPGDRIEHAGIAPDHLIADIAELGLHVVTQPHFIAERGDRYLQDVEREDRGFLYRAAAFPRAGVVLAAGSDAPFGTHDPWAAMRAAVSRRTVAGAVIGADEALAPDEAVALYLGDPLDLAQERRIAPGAPADLCLLDRPWAEARSRLLAEDVRLTMIAGIIVHDGVDETPREGGACANPAA